MAGDAALKQSAEAEQVEMKGSIWLIGEMVREQSVTVAVARAAPNKMRLNGRRLPWDAAKQILAALDAPSPSKM
jgi:hypothetical protein